MERELLILTALQHEATAIAKALKRANRPDEQRHTRLCVIGPGAAHLAQLERRETRGIILAGLGGGLAPELPAGEVVIDERSDCADLDVPWRKGKFHSARQIVASPLEKADLFRTTGALVVDMESDVVQRLAEQWAVPYLGVRVVLDRADEQLDPALLCLTDASGRVKPGRLAAELLTRPTFIATLLRMRSRSAAALRNLSSAVRHVMQQDRFGCSAGCRSGNESAADKTCGT